MKKILFISPDNPFLRKTGGQVMDYFTIKRFAKFNKVHVASLCENPALIEPDDITLHYLNRRHPKASSLYGKIVLIFQILFNKLPRPASIINTPENHSLIQSIINSYDIDIIIFNHLESLIFHQSKSKKKVAIHHNNESKLSLSLAKTSRNPLLKLIHYIEHWKIKKFMKEYSDADISHYALSENECVELAKIFKSNCELFPVHIGQTNNLTDEKNNIYIFGNWDYLPTRSGLELIINHLNSFPSLIKIRISGSCSSSEFISKISKIPNVDWLGFIDHDDVRSELNRAMITVIPIFSGAGVKIKLVEALECGACILTTNHALEGLPKFQLLNDSVHLFDSPSDLIQKLDVLLKSKDLRLKLRHHANEYASQYQKLGNNTIEAIIK